MRNRGLHSNYDMFVKRGDDWFTERDRKESFRTAPYENPDMDRVGNQVQPRKLFRQPPKPMHPNQAAKTSYEQRADAIMNRIHKRLATINNKRTQVQEDISPSRAKALVRNMKSS